MFILNVTATSDTGYLCKVVALSKDFTYLFFRERGREGEREGEKHQCVVVPHVPPTGDLAHCPGKCPDWELKRQSFGLQARALSTELHQPGPK